MKRVTTLTISGAVPGNDYNAVKKCGEKGTIGRPCSKKRYLFLVVILKELVRFANKDPKM